MAGSTLNTESVTKDHATHQADSNTQHNTAIEAAVFRRLLQHLSDHSSVQNIDLMNLAGFCRNCLAKWYAAEAEAQGVSVDYEQARERIYGMPYPEWKAQHQTPATPEQQAAFEARAESSS